MDETLGIYMCWFKSCKLRLMALGVVSGCLLKPMGYKVADVKKIALRLILKSLSLIIENIHVKAGLANL